MYDKKKFAKVITGEETRVFYVEPKRKVSKRVWATTNISRPTVAKRCRTVKKVVYVIFNRKQVFVLQIPASERRPVTVAFYKKMFIFINFSRLEFKIV